MRRLLAVVLAAAAIAPAAGASGKTGFAFGRAGGSIRPFTVVITTDGAVRATGSAGVGRRRLTLLQLGTLNRLAATSDFGSLAPRTDCPGTLPDVALTFIRVGPRTVRVHGDCVASYRQLWNALARAVRLSP